MTLEWCLRRFRFVRRLEERSRRLEDAVRRSEEAVRRTEEAYRRIEGENAEMVADTALWRKFFPPGHFHSPLPSSREIAEAFERDAFGPPFSAVDLNEAGQFDLLKKFAEYYPEQPFPEQPAPGRRFYLDNPSYGRFDAIILYCMLRHLQPKQIIEVGSGFSSAAMLDVNALAMDGRMSLTLIDPDTSRVRNLLLPEDYARINLVQKPVQDVPLELFSSLEANDVLFIDSSHVSKVGSDVNRLFFDVLPVLRAGVHVHIHDVTGRLEYPRDWFEQGRAWNEQSLLRAFLMYNRAFSVVFFSSWIHNVHQRFLVERMASCAGGGGGQIWLCKNRC